MEHTLSLPLFFLLLIPQQQRPHIAHGSNSTIPLEFVRLINYMDLDRRMSAGQYVAFSKLVELGYLDRVQSIHPVCSRRC